MQWDHIAALALGWFVALNLIELGITRVYWNKYWRGPSWMPVMTLISLYLWRAAGIAVVFVFFQSVEQNLNPRGGHIAGPAYAVAIVGAWAMIGSFLLSSRLWQRARFRVAGGRRGRRSLWVELRRRRWTPQELMVFYPLVFVLYPFVNVGGKMLLIYGPMIFFMADSFRRRRRSPGGSVEMEDLPLRWEIAEICKGFGRDLRQVFVRTQPFPDATARIPLFLLDNPYGDSRPRLVVPLENVQQLNPAAYTAALAAHYARQLVVRINKEGVTNPITPSFLLLFVLMLIVFVVTIVVPTQQQDPGWTGFVAVGVVLLFVLGYFILRMYFVSTRALAHLAAYQVWSSTEPPASRTLHDYINAIAEHHALHHRISDPDLVLHQLRLDPGFIRFVSQGADVEATLGVAAAHLRRMQEVREPVTHSG